MGEIYVWYLCQSFIDGSNIWGVDRTDPWGPKMDHPQLGRSYLVVVPLYDMSGALFLLTGHYGWDFMAGIDINPSSMGPIFGVWEDPPLGSRNRPSAIKPQLFGSSAVVWYINGSNIRGVGRTDPWGHEKDHPPLCRSYLVVVPSYHVSGALILITGLYWWDSMADLISILHRWVQYLGCE